MKYLLFVGKSVFFNPKIMEKVCYLALQNSEKVHFFEMSQNFSKFAFDMAVQWLLA